jgi:hypothetical protein
MEYIYKVTSVYDGNKERSWRGIYDNALEAVNAYNAMVDYGFAHEYRTVNLSEPNGKMHTKIFYRDGKVVTK